MAKKKTTKKSTSSSKDNPEIKGLLWIALGLILTIGIYTEAAGYFSIAAKDILFFLIGVGAYVVPIYIIYFGVLTIKTHGKITLNKNILPISIILINTVVMVSTFGIDTLRHENLGFIDFVLSSFHSPSGADGGVLALIIAYPLYKIIGFIGSLVVYLFVYVICTIIVFDLSILNMGIFVKTKSNDIKSKSKKIKAIEKKTVPIIEASKEEQEGYREGINKKIKILDFMKNASIHDEQEEAIEVEKPREIAVYQMGDAQPDKPEEKKQEKKLDSNVKEDVNREITEKITESKVDVKYTIPPLEYLNLNKSSNINKEDKKELIALATKLEETLGSFSVEAKVLQVTKGPAVTRFELQPSAGVKVSKIVNLSDDIALSLAASGVRIEAPIPGKAAVGIEIPNKDVKAVFFREVLDDEKFRANSSSIAFAIGKDIAGQCVVADLSKMPHLLIAGATGSGKSVCINTLIMSILYKYSPGEVSLLMIDPKVVELSVYNGIPHLLIPVVTDPKKAAGALNWAVNEMTRRYKLFAETGVRNIQSYNSLMEKSNEDRIPSIVIIVDELADLMMVCPNDVEEYITRLSQMARAAGMHLVLATQRPSVDVITGVIKANIPSRISFAVSSQIDSRTIIDSAGAEKLLGKGDMLFYPVGESKPQRIQGAFISEEEVEKIVTSIKAEREDTQYDEQIIEHINSESISNKNLVDDSETDELLDEAIKIVVESGQASASYIQRRLRIGFNRAARIVEQLEEREVIGRKDGSKPRQVLISKEELEDF